MSNFRARTILTLFFALVIGMVLIDGVIFLLVGQYTIHREVLEVKRLLPHVVGSLPANSSASSITMRESLQAKVREIIGPDCQQVEFALTETAEFIDSGVDRELQMYAAKAGTSNQSIVATYSDYRPPFSFLPASVVVAVPVSAMDESGMNFKGVAAVLSTQNVFADLLNKQKIILVYILIQAIILATLAFFRLRNVLFDPVTDLVEVADNYHVAEGQLFPESGGNEFGQLSKAMNSMVERIERDRDKLKKTVESLAVANKRLKSAQEDVVRAEKLAAAGRLFAGFAHEIGNPVTIVQGYLELLENEDLEPEDRQQFAQRGIKELRRIDNLINQLLDATRKDDDEVTLVDLNRLAGNVAEILDPSFSRKGIRFTVEYSTRSPAVPGNAEKFHQVLLNLLINAMDAVAGNTGEGGPSPEVTLLVRSEKEDDQTRDMVCVSDNGCGISEENRKFIFEPFFTTKDPGKGTGLGLAVSYRIIQSFGGIIEVTNEEERGTTFCVVFSREQKSDSGGKI